MWNRFSGQHQEDGLEGVLGTLAVAHELPADAQHHRTVASEQGGESGLADLAIAAHESLDQLPVGEASGGAALEERAELFSQ